eukprot:2405220-Amphidinium_carterae.1
MGFHKFGNTVLKKWMLGTVHSLLAADGAVPHCSWGNSAPINNPWPRESNTSSRRYRTAATRSPAQSFEV